MYWMNDNGSNAFKIYKQKAVAEEIGLTKETLNTIIRQKKYCSKLTAYCITKFLNPEAEIEKYFIRKEK